MPVAGVNPTTEGITSWRLNHRVDEMTVERVFHGFGTLGQVWRQSPLAGGSVPIPKMGDALPLWSYTLDPLSAENKPTPELLGFDVRWLARLHVGDIRIVADPRDKTVKDVVVTYSTRAPADPQAPDVQISIVSETFLLKWDNDGNPIAPGFEAGVPTEVAGLEMAWTQSMDNFVDVIDEIVVNIGKTNSKAWSVAGMALAGKDSETGDTHQWVFLGADAFKSGEVNWRPTFRFRWLPPIEVGFWSVPGTKPNESTADIAWRRGKYYYWYNEKANGAIDQRPFNNLDPDNKDHGLQRTPIRGEFDFNEFFSDDRFENPDGGE